MYTIIYYELLVAERCLRRKGVYHMNKKVGKRPFKERMIAFMMGRNGPDNLYNFLMYTCILLIVINLFLRSFVISLLYLVMFAYALFRFMSRNLYKRQKENVTYLKIKQKVFAPFKLMHAKIRDRKTHVYKKCPSCKKVLRLPKKSGEHTVVCPCCRNRFDVTIK